MHMQPPHTAAAAHLGRALAWQTVSTAAAGGAAAPEAATASTLPLPLETAVLLVAGAVPLPLAATGLGALGGGAARMEGGRTGSAHAAAEYKRITSPPTQKQCIWGPPVSNHSLVLEPAVAGLGSGQRSGLGGSRRAGLAVGAGRNRGLVGHLGGSRRSGARDSRGVGLAAAADDGRVEGPGRENGHHGG